MTKKTSTKTKPVRKKRVAMKIAEVKPSSEIQQVAEKPMSRDINWDVIGFSAAAITLFGAALLFMMGWTYLVNWYGYYGINMAQLSIPPQTYLIKSLPGVITILSYLLIATVFYLLPPLIKKSKIEFSNHDWFWIFSLTELFVLLSLFIPLTGDSVVAMAFKETYEVTYLKYLLIPPALLVFVVLFDLLTDIIAPRSRRLKLKDAWQKQVVYSRDFIQRNSQLLSSGILLYMFFTSLTLFASYGINDASRGIQASGNWRAQKVILNILKDDDKSLYAFECTESSCLNKPFALIAETEHEYFLIDWKFDDNQKFPYHPGLFIVPRTDKIILLPVASDAPSNEGIHMTPIPQPIMSATPIYLPTQSTKTVITPTLKMKPTSTPIQP